MSIFGFNYSLESCANIFRLFRILVVNVLVHQPFKLLVLFQRTLSIALGESQTLNPTLENHWQMDCYWIVFCIFKKKNSAHPLTFSCFFSDIVSDSSLFVFNVTVCSCEMWTPCWSPNSTLCICLFCVFVRFFTIKIGFILCGLRYDFTNVLSLVQVAPKWCVRDVTFAPVVCYAQLMIHMIVVFPPRFVLHVASLALGIRIASLCLPIHPPFCYFCRLVHSSNAVSVVSVICFFSSCFWEYGYHYCKLRFSRNSFFTRFFRSGIACFLIEFVFFCVVLSVFFGDWFQPCWLFCMSQSCICTSFSVHTSTFFLHNV